MQTIKTPPTHKTLKVQSQIFYIIEKGREPEGMKGLPPVFKISENKLEGKASYINS